MTSLQRGAVPKLNTFAEVRSRVGVLATGVATRHFMADPFRTCRRTVPEVGRVNPSHFDESRTCFT